MAPFYASLIEISTNLRVDARVIARINAQTPVPKSTLRKTLRKYSNLHDIKLDICALIVDTRVRPVARA